MADPSEQPQALGADQPPDESSIREPGFIRRRFRSLRSRYAPLFDHLSTGVVLVVVAGVGLLAAWFALEHYINPSTSSERADYVRTFAQIAAGALVAIGLYWTARNVQVNREGQITERYTRAIDQLGARDEQGEPQLEIRLGAIYALERIARDSPRDQSTIVEVLTAYVRQHSPWPPLDPAHLTVTFSGTDRVRTPALRDDIQSILTVLGRRPKGRARRWEKMLDLSKTDLRGYDFTGGDFTRAIFRDSHLEGAHLMRAVFDGTVLFHTHLQGTNLINARFGGAHIFDADFTDAIGLTEEQLEEAELVSHVTLSQGLTRATK